MVFHTKSCSIEDTADVGQRLQNSNKQLHNNSDPDPTQPQLS